MPGHIEDDAIIGAQIVAVGEDAQRASFDGRKDETSASAVYGAHAQAALPIGEKDIEVLGEGLEDFPSEEDLHTLRRVADYIPPQLFTIAFIELCERFSYYGTVIVVCLLASASSETSWTTCD